MSEPWRPVKVVVLDLEHLPETISRARRYGALWALVRERVRPRGMVKVPFVGEELTRDQLQLALLDLPPATPGAPLRWPHGEAFPRVSVVVCTALERPELLHRCLRSLAALDYPNYEVIVVDNRPGEPRPLELEDARVVREPRRGLSAARNRGLEEASGEIAVYTDDDVEVDPAWLLAIALRFRYRPEEACVTGLALPRELESPAQVAIEEYYGGFGPRVFEPVSHRLRIPPGRGILRPATVDAIGDDGKVRRSFSLYATGTFGAGANMSFRAPVLRELGGFDAALGPGTPTRNGEELAVFAKLAWRGYNLGFEPAALVHHTHRREDVELERQIEGYGVGYGALLTDLIIDDPRHIGRMAGTAGRAVRVFGGGFRRKLDQRQSDERTRQLARLELRGIAAGPAAYLLSRSGRWR